MRGITVEGSPCLANANQIYSISGMAHTHSSQNSLLSKDWPDAPPQSPLTDSTISSQESSAAELIDHGAAHSILGLGGKFIEGSQATYESLSANSSFDR